MKPTENPSTQLHDLKQYIYFKTGIPANSQKLVYKNKLLVDDNFLDAGRECKVFLNFGWW